jgi:hypothetical protein
MAEKLTPIDEVGAELNRRELDCSDDKRDWLRRSRLIGQSRSLADGTKRRGLTPEDTHQLIQVLMIDKHLGGGIDHDKLAFFMAFHGVKYANCDLVGKFVRKSVDAFLGLGRRSFDRRGTGRSLRRRGKASNTAEGVARLLVRQEFRALKWGRSPKVAELRDLFEHLLTIFIAVCFQGKDMRSFAPDIRRIVSLVYPERASAEIVFASVFPSLLIESETLRVQIGKSGLLREIDQVRKQNPMLIVRCANDARLLLVEMQEAIGEATGWVQEEQPTAKTVNETILQKMFGHMPTLTTAFLLHLHLQGTGDDLVGKLRMGQDIGVRTWFRDWARFVKVGEKRLQKINRSIPEE